MPFLDRGVDDWLVVSDAVPERVQARHQASHLLAATGAIWKSTVKLVYPELVVMTIEQGPPKPEGEIRHHPGPSRLLLRPLDGDNCVRHLLQRLGRQNSSVT